MRSTRNSPQIHGTTVLCVRKDNKVVLAADGQVTMGEGVIKHSAKKTRRLYNDKIVAGFAGSTADALSLFGRFENKLQEFHGNLARSAVELAKEWRTDRSLRHLDALLIVADAKGTLAKHTKMSAKDIAQEAMKIASDICIFTNANFSIEEL
jgi:ATP-dependent HslUV protease subunit HslV